MTAAGAYPPESHKKSKDQDQNEACMRVAIREIERIVGDPKEAGPIFRAFLRCGDLPSASANNNNIPAL